MGVLWQVFTQCEVVSDGEGTPLLPDLIRAQVPLALTLPADLVPFHAFSPPLLLPPFLLSSPPLLLQSKLFERIPREFLKNSLEL